MGHSGRRHNSAAIKGIRMTNYVVVIACGEKDIDFIMEAEAKPTFNQVVDFVMHTPEISSQLGGAGLHSFSVVSVEEK